MSLPKFEFKLQEDKGFLIHNEAPRCKALLSDEDNLFENIEWKDPAQDEVKEAIIQEMSDWYWHDLQGID